MKIKMFKEDWSNRFKVNPETGISRINNRLY